MRHAMLALIVLALTGLLSVSDAYAQERPSKAEVLGPRYQGWLETFKREALADGIRERILASVFDTLKLDTGLPDLTLPWAPPRKKPTGSQAEFSKTPDAYLNTRHFDFLLKRGRGLAKKYGGALQKIEARYGVPKEIILAIWGRETSFGSYRPKHDIFRALTTQAYLGRRSPMFRRQLKLALRMLQEGHATRSILSASWAGATGLTQFMPSDFYDYAVDFDGDGRRNLWSSVPDALASTARSLEANGWKRDRPWGYEVTLPAGLDCTLEGEARIRTLREWAAMGIVRTRGRSFTNEMLDQKTYLLLPAGTYGPAFLMTENFLVIKTYNFANLYALFVGHLADRIRGGRRFAGAWQSIRVMREDNIVRLQEAMRDDGYTVGKIDGKVGPKTRNAVGALQKARKFKLDCFPTRGLLKAIGGAPS